MKTYKLLIFDWDGTLMNSQNRIVSSFQAASIEVGLEPRAQEHISYLIGLSLPNLIKQLYPEATEQQRIELANRYREHFLHKNPFATTLFPNVAETLHTLHQQGYQLAIATGKSRIGLNRDLAETQLQTLFDSTRCAEETQAKPHPQMLHEIMDELATLPPETVMIGDTTYDLQMAQAAGVDAVAVTYGAHSKVELSNCHPKVCLDNLALLPTWLQGLQ